MGAFPEARTGGAAACDLPQIQAVSLRRGGGAGGRGNRRPAGPANAVAQASRERGRNAATACARAAGERPLHDQHKLVRSAVAPARLPPGDGQGTAARDAGSRDADGIWLGFSISADRSILRLGDDRHRGGFDESWAAARHEATVRLHGLAGLRIPKDGRPCWPRRSQRRFGALPAIQASDRDAGAIQIAQSNAERAGVADCIEFTQQAVSAIQPPQGPGWVVTNPPYGLRVSQGKDLRNLYAQLGNVLRRSCPGWQAAILCSDKRLLAQTGLKLDTSFETVNGGVKVWLGREVECQI